MKRILFFISLFISAFAFGQNIHNRGVRIFYALDYGLNVNDSTVDNQAAIQRAITAAQLSTTGGTVHLPWGVFGVNSTLTIAQSDIYIEGEGSGTVLKALSDYGDVIAFTPTTNPATLPYQFHDIGVRNLKIRSAVARTSGYAIGSIYTHNLTIDHVIIGDLRTSASPFNVITPFYGGISFKFGSNFLMQNTMINAWHEGVYISGKSLGTGVFNTSNFDGLITGNNMITGDSTKWHPNDTTVGIKIDGGAGGFQLEETNVSYYTNNVKITANYGTNREVYLNHAFSSDNSGTHGIDIRPGSLQILQMTGGWSCGSGRAGPGLSGNGINISASNTTLSVVITGGTYYANNGYGIMDSSGTFTLSGAMFKANSSPNTVNDIYLGTGITSSVIVGCLTPVGITNANTTYTQMVGNINQPVYNQNTSSVGAAQNYWLDNSGNYITIVKYGSAFAGNTGGIANASASGLVSNKPIFLGTSLGGSSTPLYLGSNMSASVGINMILDSSKVKVTSQSTSAPTLTILGAGSQTADLQRWSASDYTTLSSVASNGHHLLNTSTDNSWLTINGSEAHGYRAITAIRTLDITDYLVNCTANSFTVTLPTAVGITGRQYIIKNTGSATTITIATTSSQTIDGAAPGTVTTLVPLRVMSDGANWITF